MASNGKFLCMKFVYSFGVDHVAFSPSSKRPPSIFVTSEDGPSSLIFDGSRAWIEVGKRALLASSSMGDSGEGGEIESLMSSRRSSDDRKESLDEGIVIQCEKLS